MNIGFSIKIALVRQRKEYKWLAIELGVSRQQVSKWASGKYVGGQSIDRLAKVFGMKSSEFIAIGED